MTLEYDTTTRRIRIQIPEEVYRAIEKAAEEKNQTVSKFARKLFEDATAELVKTLTLEDEMVVNERIKKNIEERMKARKKK
jgi:uncharacterized protein (DUF1778 family)